ncbi:MAG: IscS subfamily cysteine desulfurase [Bacteroidetes bacterium]|nr:IscS subfamily cysteine desulfurase [Bacteroidota bacterium]MCW5897284.1 IscS subfamily cysteine desulfurase [Bacteroidota bacterium]
MKELRLPIYLDNHSTTQVDPRVVEAMLPYFSEQYGNAASKQHEFGWRAEAAVEAARKTIARLVGAEKSEIVFTSGATESINLALKGIAEAYLSKGNHIITASTEHKAVLDTCKRLEKYGFQITVLPVDQYGFVSIEDVEKAITEKTIVVSIMMANNEIGTLAPIRKIGEMCRKRNIIFHTDATQAVGKIPVDVKAMNVDLVSFSSHKLYGPKGIGALFVRNATPSLRVLPQIDGGGHESGLRSGTLNVPAIVGFGEAAKVAQAGMEDESVRTRNLRNRLENGILTQVPDSFVNGHPMSRLPNNSNITFRFAEADRIMMEMKDVAVSSGSACSSSESEPSHVLRAIGLSNEEAKSSIRIGVGRFTTEQEIDYVIQRIRDVVQSVRAEKLRVQLTH